MLRLRLLTTGHALRTQHFASLRLSVKTRTRKSPVNESTPRTTQKRAHAKPFEKPARGRLASEVSLPAARDVAKQRPPRKQRSHETRIPAPVFDLNDPRKPKQLIAASRRARYGDTASNARALTSCWVRTFGCLGALLAGDDDEPVFRPAARRARPGRGALLVVAPRLPVAGPAKKAGRRAARAHAELRRAAGPDGRPAPGCRESRVWRHRARALAASNDQVLARGQHRDLADVLWTKVPGPMAGHLVPRSVEAWCAEDRTIAGLLL